MTKLKWGFALPLCMVIVAPLLGVSTADHLPRQPSKVPKEALTVRLSTDKATYGLREPIAITALLTNVSEVPFYLDKRLKWGAGTNFSLGIRDFVTKKPVDIYVYDDSIPFPPRSTDDFVELGPNNIYGTVRHSLPADINIRQAGRYTLTVGYRSPIPDGFAFGLHVFLTENGTVLSNDVTITIAN